MNNGYKQIVQDSYIQIKIIVKGELYNPPQK